MIDGVLVGHWTDAAAETGCTVVLFPDGTVASGEIRGGAPATREFALLDPSRTVERIDALVLTGGSAFGLAAADGVQAHLVEREIGFATDAGPVPIVVALALFDLLTGDGVVRPDAAAGRAAAEAAQRGDPPVGRVGAGTGATLGKWRGREHASAGGIATHVARSAAVEVAALMAVNGAGDIDDGTTMAAIDTGAFEFPEIAPFENTTIGLVVTNANLTKAECQLVAQSGQDGYGRALVPAHTAGDGDALVAAATGMVEAPLGLVRLMATHAVETAIRSIGADTIEG